MWDVDFIKNQKSKIINRKSKAILAAGEFQTSPPIMRTSVSDSAIRQRKISSARGE